MTRGQRSKDVKEQVAAINRKLKGWSNYFCLGPVNKAYGAVDYHAVGRLRQWLCKKYKVRGAGTARFSAEYLYLELGLVRLRWAKRNFPRATA
jgi:RNA-directed DNA polymerase